MRAWILAWAALAACGSDPKRVPPSDVDSKIRALPDYTTFALSGLAFHGDRLYASSNLGLFEIEGESLRALLQWRDDDAVVEGPWADPANGALWAWEVRPSKLLRLDQRGWAKLPLPRPKRGWYSRGDMLWGFESTAARSGFWLHGAGTLWRWDPASSTWDVENHARGSLRVWAPLDDGLFALVGRQDVKDGPRYVVLVRRDGDVWTDVPATKQDVDLQPEDVVVTPRAANARTRDGRLYRVDARGLSDMRIPAACEAVAATSDGAVLAAFVGKGIQEFRDGWRPRFDCPYPADVGKHGAYLAERNGQVAFATSATTEVVDGDTGQRRVHGLSAVWVSREGRLQRVPLGSP